MITNFTQNPQVKSLTLRIAQEAGSSSGRVYLADILTKLGILNTLFKVLSERIGATERDSKGLWKLRSSGLQLLKQATEFRCAIAEIVQNIINYWAGEKDEDGKAVYQGANHSRNSIKKALRWFESLGVLRLDPEIETPVFSRVKGEAQYKSPDKKFLGFNLVLALEAYEALEQLLRQHLEMPRRLRVGYKMPKHAGMLSRLIFIAIMGRKYRAFSRLPDDVAPMPYGQTEQRKAIADRNDQVDELINQINEYSILIDGIPGELIYESRVNEIREMKAKAERAIAAIGREMAFADLPY